MMSVDRMYGIRFHHLNIICSYSNHIFKDRGILQERRKNGYLLRKWGFRSVGDIH